MYIKNIRAECRTRYQNWLDLKSLRDENYSFNTWLYNFCGQSEAVLSAFLIGCCIPLFQISLLGLPFLIGASIALLLACQRWRLCYCIAAFCVGLSWVSYCFTQQLSHAYPSQLERVSVQVEGQILGLPTRKHSDLKFEFLINQVKQLDGTSIDGLMGNKVLLSCYRCSLDILPNQQWRFTVRLKRPHGFASWGAFDYEKYLFRRQVIAKGYVRLKESNELLNEGQDNINQWRWQIGEELKGLQQRTQEPESSPGYAIMLALAIGDKSMLTKEQRTVFQDTGVSHLMAISGLHVGLVFVGVSFIFTWLLWPIARVFELIPRQHLVLLPALASAFLYSALAGFAVSTQRALTMLCVYVICRLLIRDVSLFKILLISACLIVIVSPWSILDVGFWLSCGAVFIIALANAGAKSAASGAWSLVRLQPKLWLGMSPMTILFFGQISLVSPLVNLLAVPLFCTVLIPATLLAVCLQQLGLGDALLVLLSHCYHWVYLALAWVADLPLAKWYSEPWFWLQWLIFAGLFVSIVARFSIKITTGLVLSLLLAVAFNPMNHQKGDELDLTLLDVGQGLAMVVLKPNYVMVYDTGPRYGTGFSAAEAVVLPYLRSRGIRKIDMLIISHADNDHIGGYRTVVDAFDVTQVLTSRVDKLPDAKNCVAGQAWQVGESHFSIISPEKNTPNGSNNRSCVLAIEHFGTRVLITGDIEKQVERYLLKTQASELTADIMLVPHQGSKTSSTSAFIDAVQPKIALIAAGYLNHYGHPHPAVVERYNARKVDLVSSIDNGSVRLNINRHGWQRTSYRDAQRRFWHHQKKPNWDR